MVFERKVRHIELNAAVEVVVRHIIRPITQAGHYRELMIGVECVLNVETRNWAAQGVLLLLALLEWRRTAERPLQEVEALVTDGASTVWPAAAVFAVEREDAVALIGVS